MKVVIVGAGIGGLSAGIALRRAGHDVQILEKSMMLREVGAAINLQSNATRVLENWGFSSSRTRAVVARTFTYSDGKSLNVLDHQVLKGTTEKYGAEFYYAHRVDLHNELKHLATREEGLGKPVEILLQKTVAEYDVEAGRVTCTDGSSFSGDLLIGADGVHSGAVKYIIGHDNPAISTGKSCFRLLVPTKDLIYDPETSKLMENIDGKFQAFIDSSNRVFICYPCRNHEIQNVCLIYPDKGCRGAEDWNAGVNLEALLSEASDYHPSLQAVLKKAQPGDIKRWALLSRETLPTWHQQRLVVIGDAAHPMLPFQGQAGAQAIEDAAALEVLFSNFEKVDLESISTRLQSFENVRLNHASAIQMLSNNTFDGEDNLVAVTKPYMSGQKVPTKPQEQAHWRMAHDVIKESQTELARISENEQFGLAGSLKHANLYVKS